MISGFILGTGSSPVLIRALGPSLSQFGIADVVQDPALELYDEHGTLVSANDNWKQTQQSAIQATGIPPSDDREAAIFTILPSGPFTTIVRDVNNASGIALLEVYNLQLPLSPTR